MFDPTRPLKISDGRGVNSVAMLAGLHTRGIRPDVILHANTGGEKPETYAYEATLQAWLRSVGFPVSIEVAYQPVRAPYSTLEGKCEANETLPSLAFGRKSCSLVFKKEPQEKWLRTWQPAVDCWASGRKVQVCIGYDAGKPDMRRSKLVEDEHYEYRYPLREWGWDRAECERQIVAAGLPVPPKSACWFCPASKRHEVEALRDAHPELFARALAMEDLARTGKHGLQSTKGLGRNWSWAEVARS